jgi:hypothetical protein
MRHIVITTALPFCVSALLLAGCTAAPKTDAEGFVIVPVEA